MRRIVLAVAVATVFAGSACAAGERAAGGNVCLPTYDIKQTVVSPDERAITFHMKSGKTWINTLPAQCRGLNLHGFSYTSRTINEVCAGQGIQLVQTGTVCQLGQFAEAPPPASAN
ncbi:MAG: hypothetical protein ACT4OG_10660 [Alphaproteobacteria bacterium]